MLTLAAVFLRTAVKVAAPAAQLLLLCPLAQLLPPKSLFCRVPQVEETVQEALQQTALVEQAMEIQRVATGPKVPAALCMDVSWRTTRFESIANMSSLWQLNSPLR